MTATHGSNGSAAAAGPSGLDDTTKLGLLLEAAHAHQQLIETSLERLESHSRGLDGVVRDEIRRTFVAECGALEEEIAKASAALQRMQRIASLRTAAWSIGVVATLLGASLLTLEHVVPSTAQLEALRTEKSRLILQIRALSAAGARIDLRHCGVERRLCARIDRRAPTYGDGGDYLILEGY